MRPCFPARRVVNTSGHARFRAKLERDHFGAGRWTLPPDTLVTLDTQQKREQSLEQSGFKNVLVTRSPMSSTRRRRTGRSS
jgi:hypothetical protein